MMKRKLISELKYQKEMLKQARTPHQRDSGKFKIRQIKRKLGEMKNGVFVKDEDL